MHLIPNPDFRVNPDSDPDVRQIAAKMLWIHYPVGIRCFVKCRDCMRNANKSPKIPCSAMVREVEN